MPDYFLLRCELRQQPAERRDDKLRKPGLRLLWLLEPRSKPHLAFLNHLRLNQELGPRQGQHSSQRILHRILPLRRLGKPQMDWPSLLDYDGQVRAAPRLVALLLTCPISLASFLLWSACWRRRCCPTIPPSAGPSGVRLSAFAA